MVNSFLSKSFLLAATIFGFTSAFAESAFNVNDYNLVCVGGRNSNRGQVYFNNYTLALGLRLNTDGGFLADLDTVLVEPVSGCHSCYDITAATHGREHVYLAKVRTLACSDDSECLTNHEYSVAVYETQDDPHQETLVLGRSPCTQNLP